MEKRKETYRLNDRTAAMVKQAESEDSLFNSASSAEAKLTALAERVSCPEEKINNKTRVMKSLRALFSAYALWTLRL